MPLLPHVFEPNFAKQYKLHQEFSDKVMDYAQNEFGKANAELPRKLFTRYQWSIIQKDRNTKG